MSEDEEKKITLEKKYNIPEKQKQNVWDLYPKPFQEHFCLSTKRYPAIIAGIGTGKTMWMLLKVWKYCETYPNSLAMIVRKEYTDLRDSTLRDVSTYFSVSVDGDKNYTFSNGSCVMFRHGSEYNVLKNINLSVFAIEQAEEFETDEPFTWLRDRLRRKGAPYRQGIVIANANGHNWLYEYFIRNAGEQYDCVQATTYDNADNLPQDFLDDLSRMRVDNPAHYNRMVMNSHEEDDTSDVLITTKLLESLRTITKYTTNYTSSKRVIGCDPSLGGDECVIYCIEDGAILDSKILHTDDEMRIVGEIVLMDAIYKTNLTIVDKIGFAGIPSRLEEVWAEDIRNKKKKVVALNSSEKAEGFFNKRSEVYWNLFMMMKDGKVCYPEDPELRRQLSTLRYKIVESSGIVRILSKDIVKKELKQSPDRADAFAYTVYGLRLASEQEKYDYILEKHNLRRHHLMNARRKKNNRGYA